MPGVTLFNCIIIALGLILSYKILPETEGRALEDIELHFSDKTKSITDHKIPKMKSTKTVDKENQRIGGDVASKPISVISTSDAVKKDGPNGCDNKGFMGDKF